MKVQLARVHPLAVFLGLLFLLLAPSYLIRLTGMPGGAPGLAMVLAVVLFFRWDRWRRQFCRLCGVDLDGQSVGICPECEEAVRTASTLDLPFCFQCGYDLQGLELPRACPECGRVADPAADAERARTWFAGRWAAMHWMCRPSRVPAGVCYALSDDASLQLARRRERRWLWPPALLAALSVAVGCLVAIEYDVDVWYYDRSDPQRKPLRTAKTHETDRLYGLDLHLFRGGLLFKTPASWEMVVDRRRRGIGLSVPDEFDPLFLVWGVPLLWVLILGYYPARAAARGRVGVGRSRRPHLRRSREAAWTLIAPPLGMVFWLWLATSWTCAVCKLVGRDVVVLAAFVLMPACLGLWVLALQVGVVRLLREDRARRFVADRRLAWAALTFMSIGIPVLVYCLLAWTIM